jgi:hypothetical protein
MMSDITQHRTLLSEVKQLIEHSREQVAVAVNSAITLLYWQVGKRINEEVLLNRRAGYGEYILATLSAELTTEYGRGWGEKHLRHCLRIAETIPDKEILYALSRELSWTHLRSIIYVEEPLKREFYIEMCKLEKWSTRTLQDRINSMLYERTAISKRPDLTIENDINSLKNHQQLSPDLKLLEQKRCHPRRRPFVSLRVNSRGRGVVQGPQSATGPSYHHCCFCTILHVKTRFKCACP